MQRLLLLLVLLQAIRLVAEDSTNVGDIRRMPDAVLLGEFQRESIVEAAVGFTAPDAVVQLQTPSIDLPPFLRLIRQTAAAEDQGIRFAVRFALDTSRTGTFRGPIRFRSGLVVSSYCPADFNLDGGVDGSDVSSFFESWEAGDSLADVNRDGGVDGSDIDTFFTAWEAGGC